MLIRSGDGNRKIYFRGDDFSGKPDLLSERRPAALAWRPCGPDSTFQELGEIFEKLKPVRTAYASASAHYDRGILELDAR